MFVIKVRYGGLGDHLFWSHLPRIAKESGHDRVLISKHSEYRDDSYFGLVWGRNPHVDGVTDENAPFPEFEELPMGMNILDKNMLDAGFDDGKRYHEPEVFYTPTIIPELKNKKVFDPNYISMMGEVDKVKLLNIVGDCWSVPKTRDVYHYCDIITSCKEFHCMASGGSHLAAALKKPATVYYGRGHKSMFRPSKLHTYIEVSA